MNSMSVYISLVIIVLFHQMLIEKKLLKREYVLDK